MAKTNSLHKSTFITLLGTLDKKEVSDFRAHIKKLYPRQKIAIALFDFIKNQQTEIIESRKLEVSFVYKKIFKEPLQTDSDRKKLLNYLADLNQWLREYLLWESVKKPSFDKEIMWVKILKERNLDQAFFLKIKWLHNKYSKQPAGSIWHFFKLLELNHLEYFHINKSKLKSKIPTLDNCFNYLEQFYITTRFKYNAEVLNRRDITPKGSETNTSKTKKYSVEKITQLFKLSAQFNHSPSPALYKKIKQLLLFDSGDIDLSGQGDVLSYLINFTASKINAGQSNYIKEAFELNQHGLKSGIFLMDGYISLSIFHNIVNLGCALGKFDWVDDFLDNYGKRLQKDSTYGALNLAKANVAFERKNFTEVQVLLNEVEFSDIHFALRTKSLLLRSYYELEQSQVLILDYCDSFERFIKRNLEAEGKITEAIINFIRMVKKLTHQKDSKSNMKNEIKNCRKLIFKSWLLEKVKVYEQKFTTRN